VRKTSLPVGGGTRRRPDFACMLIANPWVSVLRTSRGAYECQWYPIVDQHACVQCGRGLFVLLGPCVEYV
jgi:hypothetical protein